jgi:hypothetical protein
MNCVRYRTDVIQFSGSIRFGPDYLWGRDNRDLFIFQRTIGTPPKIEKTPTLQFEALSMGEGINSPYAYGDCQLSTIVLSRRDVLVSFFSNRAATGVNRGEPTCAVSF